MSNHIFLYLASDLQTEEKITNKVNSPLEYMGSKESVDVREYNLYPFVVPTASEVVS